MKINNKPFMYRLDGHEPVAESDPVKWGEWFAEAGTDRLVANDKIGAITVSTVFLGVDNNVMGKRPHLFETATITPAGDFEIADRYSTWDDAARGHAAVVRLYHSLLDDGPVSG